VAIEKSSQSQRSTLLNPRNLVAGELASLDPARKALVQNLVSASGLITRPVKAPDGGAVGRVADVVIRWDSGDYPKVSGLIVRIGFRRAFLPVQNIADISSNGVQLSSTKFDLRDYERRDGEFLANDDMIDHQLLDVNGARVVRAADLYLNKVARSYYVVAVDVSFRSFLRRVLPGSAGRAATPGKVIDWAGIQSFGRPGEPTRLRKQNTALTKLRAADLADLLEDLGRHERQVLLEILDPELAADAMEEMDADDLEDMLLHAPVGQAADLLARMEPDEAVDALRELPEEDREAMLDAMDEETSTSLIELLSYEDDEAGGFMTSELVILKESDTVAEARKILLELDNHDVQCIVVVDEEGRLLDDLHLIDLFQANPRSLVGNVKNESVPETVGPDADLEEVVEKLTANRGGSLVVVDEDNRPIGRIMSDDVVDALVKERSGRNWPWQEGRN
jgi:CBS domain-containing protein/sporulation protein YlmC with PRC-barrel domain